MVKWFDENGNYFILALVSVISITVLAALKIISGELAAGIIAGAGGIKLASLGGKKTLAGLVMLGAGLMGGCEHYPPQSITPTDNPLECGIQSVFGGASATDMKQVAKLTGDGKICSGALVASDVVLTAQHCRGKDTASIWGAQYGIAGTKECNYGDLAAVKISDTATDIWGAPIVPLKIYVGQLYVGDNIYIAGYGLTSKTSIPQYPTQGRQTVSEVTENVIYLDGSPGVCDGDSGGPAMYGRCLVGVHYGRIGECGDRSVITRLSAYESWLSDI
jgi:hypothetical protein